MFRAFRSAEGEHLILDDNAFIEVVMPKSILRSLRDQVHGLVACSVDNVPATMRQPVLLSAQARRGFRLLL
jgi:hypothetical protein